jgi:signal transduction histidine kinase
VVLAVILTLPIGVAALETAEGSGRFTTYAGRSAAAAAISVAVGIALACAGLASVFVLRRWSIGWSSVLAAAAWFSPMLIAWRGNPMIVPSFAMLLEGLIFAPVLHLVLAYPAMSAASSFSRLLVLVVYVETAFVAVGLALFRDPYFDPSCFANCNVNVFLVRSLPKLASTIRAGDRWFVAAAAMTLILICIARLRTGSRPARRALAPVALFGALFAAATIARIVTLRTTQIEDPSNDLLFGIFVGEACALVALGASIIAAAFRTWLRRRSVARIVADVDAAPLPGSLQTALARGLGDHHLQIAYPVASDRGFIDAEGRRVDPPVTGSERVSTRLAKGDRTIAVVSHAAAASTLERELGPAFLLALENERLQAELLAELRELRASRSRIIQVGDAERRQLERDLHDGAQQRLIALSFDVRLAGSKADERGDVRTHALLIRAIEETRTALEELRDVAHGIYPAVLQEAGLAPALATFADAADLSVGLAEVEDRRYAAPVESAAYFAVTEAVADAVDRRAGHVDVAATHRDGRLIVTIRDDGSNRSSSLVSIIDRVGAAGGRVVVEPTMVRAEIPCE